MTAWKPRPMNVDDPSERGFVLHPWVRCASRSEWAMSMPREAFHAGQQRIAERLILLGSTYVAEHVDVPGELAGWICAESNCLHGVYVKQVYRRMGIARMLLDHVGPLTHRSCDAIPTREYSVIKALRLDPFLAFE